ncbi:hypothetical protein K431DRAFT_283544 [Polychaeton citri CBS 116435]|uniref:Uncharacterized protein n=1 Tax=Polychaeton citri CBS 116435 TaxID=1314669 RepID=A0A9P4Q8U0_9PEZI|nr:hypothetical protein K431DRAFT_283544 [Polychaeton citri CBS 116435]
MLSPFLKKKKSVRFSLDPDSNLELTPTASLSSSSSDSTNNTTSRAHQVFQAYSFGSSAWTILQAAPLLLFPNLIVSLCATSDDSTAPSPRRMTDLESYLCRTLGLTLLALSIMSLLLSGVVPLTNRESFLQPSESSPPSSEVGTSSGNDVEGGNGTDPYAYPTLTVTTFFHGIMAFYLYTRFQYSGAFAFAMGALFSTGLFCFGLWVILFGSDKGKFSKTTGADKRTSGFPFGNKESAKEKKRESRREEKEEKEREKDEKRRSRKSVLRTKSS